MVEIIELEFSKTFSILSTDDHTGHTNKHTPKHIQQTQSLKCIFLVKIKIANQQHFSFLGERERNNPFPVI